VCSVRQTGGALRRTASRKLTPFGSFWIRPGTAYGKVSPNGDLSVVLWREVTFRREKIAFDGEPAWKRASEAIPLAKGDLLRRGGGREAIGPSTRRGNSGGNTGEGAAEKGQRSAGKTKCLAGKGPRKVFEGGAGAVSNFQQEKTNRGVLTVWKRASITAVYAAIERGKRRGSSWLTDKGMKSSYAGEADQVH